MWLRADKARECEAALAASGRRATLCSRDRCGVAERCE
jgi:hypothetical protein